MTNITIPKTFTEESAFKILYKKDRTIFFFDHVRNNPDYLRWIECTPTTIQTGLFGRQHNIEDRIEKMIEKEGWADEVGKIHS